jgi:hypothetical protein
MRYIPVAIQLCDGDYLCRPQFRGDSLTRDLQGLLQAGYQIEYPEPGTVFKNDPLGLIIEVLS